MKANDPPVIQLLSTQCNVSNPQLMAAMISYYSKTLRSLPLTTRAEKTRSFLSSSPVKILSSFWGGSNANTPEASSSSKPARPLSLHRNNSQHSFLSSLGSIRGRDADTISTEEVKLENPLVRLEQTFIGYVAALQARKGAIIGRMLLNRSMSDELAVNDLYNKLIESPYDLDTSSEAPTEVIFAAFEKFLRIAWTEQMGPVMTIQSLDTLLERANKRVPGDFADFVNFLFGDMAPQNRRAFTALMKLLADLLEGCGNDSDRGALTLAFAELLVSDGTAHNYINLLDRLVEDCDRISEEPGLNHSFNLGNQAYESINSAIRGGKSHTGSVTSNTSSLRRKFGFDTLLRQNSKDERSSVWRTLSKHRNPATGEGHITRTPIGRAETLDDGALSKRLLRRPGSRDRPPIAGTFDDPQRPTSSHRLDFPLGTIGEPPNEGMQYMTPRRKRRSSLSDLKSLMAMASLEDDAEPEPMRPLQITKQTSEKFNSSPKVTPTSRIPVTSPSATPRQKENVADAFQTPATLAPAADLDPAKKESPSKTHRHSKTLSSSGIPTLKPTRSGMSGADSPTRAGGSSPTRSGNAKLRLQSPQKLRERLQTEKKAVEEVDASLRSELSKIGEEMARVNNAGVAASPTVDLRRLTASIQSLEERIPTVMQELGDKQAALQRDMDTTVKASESKVKAIDQLYKEAVAENELLYERFNSELGKIVKALKGKGKEDKEQLMEKLKEQADEAARMKKENARLKREMVSLRAALKGTE